MPEEGIEKKPHHDILRLEDHAAIVKAMAALGVRKVRITGGEPLIVKNIEFLVREIKKIEGIKEVAITTNGILLAEKLEALKEAGLDRVNISLDSLRPEAYREITRGGDLAKVLQGMQMAIDSGLVPVKVNTVLVKGFNDHEIEDFIEKLPEGVEVRFIELMPIGEAASFGKERFLNVKARIEAIPGMVATPDYGHMGPCRYYLHEPTGRRVGIINPISDHFCGSCNRLRITSDGMMKVCLHSDREWSLKPYLHDHEQLKQAILKGVENKPYSHHLNEGEFIARNMNTIGG